MSGKFTVNPEIFASVLFSLNIFYLINSLHVDIFAAFKNSRLVHDLLISVNDRMISPFRKDFIFTKLRICEVSRK